MPNIYVKRLQRTISRFIAPTEYDTRVTAEQDTSLLDMYAMKAELDKLVDDPNKLVGEARNEVARILRVVLRENGITSKTFTQCIREWSAAKTGGDSSSKHANDSGNFIKAITKPKISFERLFTTMQILAPLSWSITIGVKWNLGPEKRVRFTYVEDPAKYERVLGRKPPPYLTPLINEDEDMDNVHDIT